MGTRPPRPRSPGPDASRPAPVMVTASRQIAPIGAPSPRRRPIVSTVPLPSGLRATLTTIAKTLRNVPREAIHDLPELFVWLNRQAKALERARDTQILAPQASARPSEPNVSAHASSASA